MTGQGYIRVERTRKGGLGLSNTSHRYFKASRSIQFESPLIV
jgi:hypothetical protein